MKVSYLLSLNVISSIYFYNKKLSLLIHTHMHV